MTTRAPEHPELTTFESSLLTDLQATVAEQPAALDASPVAVPSRRRTLTIAVAGIATAAAIVTVALVIPAVTAPPAFAVTERANGDIVVTINEFKDPDKLQSVLGEHGLDVHVTYLTMLATSVKGIVKAGIRPDLTIWQWSCADRDRATITWFNFPDSTDNRSFTIPAGAIQSGQTLLIGGQPGGDNQQGLYAVATFDEHVTPYDDPMACPRPS